jgi:hypothetical protein
MGHGPGLIGRRAELISQGFDGALENLDSLLEVQDVLLLETFENVVNLVDLEFDFANSPIDGGELRFRGERVHALTISSKPDATIRARRSRVIGLLVCSGVIDYVFNPVVVFVS